MKKSELIEKLQKIDGDFEIGIGNIMIDAGEESMPVFDLLEIAKLSDCQGEEEDGSTLAPEDEIILLLYSDADYIDPESVNVALLANNSIQS